MYYIIERNYAGPNIDQNCDADTIGIYIAPGRTNSSHEERTECWLGTTNDWAEYARGEFETIEAARAAIADLYDHVREQDASDSCDEDLVELYKPGQYEQMSRSATGDWTYDGIRADVQADTTDERITALVAEYEAAANSEGYTLDSDLKDFMEERRQELRDEADEASEA